MSEKALAIAAYCDASGAYVIFGGASPISGMPDRVNDSDAVLKYISEGWEKIYGGKLEFIPDVNEMIRKTLEHIDKKRAALGLPAWEENKFGRSGDAKMIELEKLPLEKKRAAIYGLATD
jgi:carbon-monoxide dehydrogenase catalytic subunit